MAGVAEAKNAAAATPRRSWTWCGTLYAMLAAVAASAVASPRPFRRRLSSRPRRPRPRPSPPHGVRGHAPRDRRLRRAHAHHVRGRRRGSRVPERERPEGDAARRLHAQRARPAAARRREATAGPDDPQVRQRGDERHLHPRRHHRPQAPRPRPRAWGASSRRRPIWGNSQITARDQTRFFLRDRHAAARAPPRVRPAAPAHGRRSSAGGSAGSSCPTGRSTSRAAGAPARAPSTTRSRCSCAARSALPSRSSPRTTAPTPQARRRSKASSAAS